jgi:branched-chain amino acid transport system permease protein
VTPQLCGFTLSADLVIWAAVGGRGRLLGPVLGAIVIGAATSGLRDRFQFWEIGLAIVFILVVLLFPQGAVGAFAPLERRWLGGARAGACRSWLRRDPRYRVRRGSRSTPSTSSSAR